MKLCKIQWYPTVDHHLSLMFVITEVIWRYKPFSNTTIEPIAYKSIDKMCRAKIETTTSSMETCWSVFLGFWSGNIAISIDETLILIQIQIRS